MRQHPLRHFQRTVATVLQDTSGAAVTAANGSSGGQGIGRAAENELYDSACDLLLAAQELRGAASRDGASVSTAPSLGCVEETLSVLAEAMRELDDSARPGQALDELRGALISSSSACRAAREAIGQV
jgi:hypothetical protein